MAGPGGPVNDLILQLMGAAKSRGGFESSPELLNRMRNIEAMAGLEVDPGPNVLPGPGSGRALGQDPWFDDLMSQAEEAGGVGRTKPPPTGTPSGEYFVWVTSPTGRRTRLAGPFPDAAEAQRLMNHFGKQNPRLSLSIGTMSD